MAGGNGDFRQEQLQDGFDSDNGGDLVLDESLTMLPYGDTSEDVNAYGGIDEKEEKSTAVITQIAQASAIGSLATAHQEIENRKQLLLNARESQWMSPFGDSGLLTDVKNSIADVNRALNDSIPMKKEEFIVKLEGLRGNYRTMIQKLQSYGEYIETHKRAQEGQGNAILAVTKDILEQSVREMKTLELSNDTLFDESVHGKAWRTIFNDTIPLPIILSAEEENEEENGQPVDQEEGKTMAEFMASAKEAGFNVELSSKAISQLFMLQIYDLINGRMGRSTDSYVPSFEVTADKQYTVTSIRSINNAENFNYQDIDFDHLENNQILPITDSQDRVAIPFLPKDFYGRIMAYDFNDIISQQSEILTGSELNILGQRLTNVQNSLRTLVANEKITLLNNDREWDEVRDDLLNRQREGNYARNYLPLELL